jgi:hypothetical protein
MNYLLCYVDVGVYILWLQLQFYCLLDTSLLVTFQWLAIANALQSSLILFGLFFKHYNMFGLDFGCT